MDDDVRTVLEQLGDPAEVVRELQEFDRDTRSFSDQRPQLLARYPDQWVAFLGGAVRAHGPTFQDVLEKVDRAGLPRERIVVAYLDKDDRTLIL